MARERPSVLAAFATRYRQSQAGRTGGSAKDFIMDYRELLRAAHAEDGEAHELAVMHLHDASRRSQGLLVLETHPRDDRLIHLVRLARAGGEAWLFAYLEEPSPAQERASLAAVFIAEADNAVPDAWKGRWETWCARLAQQASEGGAILPFTRDDLDANRELLSLCARLLHWRGESLMRFASCTLCGDSKRLEQLRAKLETCLRQLSEGGIHSLEDLGLMEKPRQVLLRGPLRLELPDGVLDLGPLHGPFTLSETDIRLATVVHCDAAHVLTVENETTFYELAKLGKDTLLIQTSYPGRAVLALMARLPVAIPLWHFGDTDPSGFDILRDLRERTGRAIRPLHMRFRPRSGSEALSCANAQLLERLVANPSMTDCHPELNAMHLAGSLGYFEQEMLGPPSLNVWPFYDQNG